jgi:hypothetical protein
VLTAIQPLAFQSTSHQEIVTSCRKEGFPWRPCIAAGPAHRNVAPGKQIPAKNPDLKELIGHSGSVTITGSVQRDPGRPRIAHSQDRNSSPSYPQYTAESFD